MNPQHPLDFGRRLHQPKSEDVEMADAHRHTHEIYQLHQHINIMPPHQPNHFHVANGTAFDGVVPQHAHTHNYVHGCPQHGPDTSLFGLFAGSDVQTQNVVSDMRIPTVQPSLLSGFAQPQPPIRQHHPHCAAVYAGHPHVREDSNGSVPGLGPLSHSGSSFASNDAQNQLVTSKDGTMSFTREYNEQLWGTSREPMGAPPKQFKSHSAGEVDLNRTRANGIATTSVSLFDEFNQHSSMAISLPQAPNNFGAVHVHVPSDCPQSRNRCREDVTMSPVMPQELNNLPPIPGNTPTPVHSVPIVPQLTGRHLAQPTFQQWPPCAQHVQPHPTANPAAPPVNQRIQFQDLEMLLGNQSMPSVGILPTNGDSSNEEPRRTQHPRRRQHPHKSIPQGPKQHHQHKVQSRKKTNVACTNCVKAKAGCGVERPCKRCTRLKKDRCVDRPVNPKSKRKKPTRVSAPSMDMLSMERLSHNLF